MSHADVSPEGVESHPADGPLAQAVDRWGDGDVEGARAALERNTARWPDHAESFLILGILLMEQGEDARAEQALAEAARLSPGEGAVRFRHAESLALVGRFDEAVGELATAIEMSPEEAKPYLALSRMLAASGQRPLAVQVLEGGLVATGGDERLREEVARLRPSESAPGA